MKASIRKFLLINLLLCVTATTILTAVGNLFLDNKEIQKHLDLQLIQETLLFETLIGNNLSERDINRIQDEINNVPEKTLDYFFKLKQSILGRHPKNNFEFQIWNNQGKLLLHSRNSPLAPLSNGKDGFVTKRIRGATWRIFTAYNPNSGITVVTAERYDIRNELGQELAKNDFFIMVITFPILGLLIWIIIGRGLETLKRVANEVSHRAPSYLEPVNIEMVPKEINPIIDELNKLLLRLQQALEREQRFAADAAHELRTPLAALRTQAQVALKAADEEERNIALDNVRRGVDRSTHVVKQLLTLSRLTPEATLENPVKISLSSIATETIAELVPSALKKNIEIELICSQKSIEIMGDATALHILIRNLVDNAIRYIPEGSRIQVNISQEKDKVVLQVCDNGPGIPAKLRSRVFERFFRILGNKSPGSGLGLAIVHQIAGLHNAKVTLGVPDSGVGLKIVVTFTKLN